MRVIILAAGMGSRLRPLTNDKPKCMLKLFNETLIERQIKIFHSFNINDITIVTGYRSEVIDIPDVNYVKGGSEFANKCDNLLYIWRPIRSIDFSDKSVIFGSQKIKKQKLVGYPQDVKNIQFNIKEQSYYFNNKTPFTEIDEERNNSNKSS